MQISDRLTRIKPSLTLSINSKALKLRQSGVSVISLAVGEPDFPTPAHICSAAKQAIDDNFCRYTQVAGIQELRAACAGYFLSQHGVSIPAEAILVGNGGKQCITNFLNSFVNPGDEVLIPSPYWLSYPDMVSLVGGVPVLIPTTTDQGFKISIDQLEAATTAKTKLLILNSPSNPTGAVFDEAEITNIMEWAMTRKITVLSDEIYEQLVFPPKTTKSAIHWLPKYPDYVCVANGLSKSFAMTGWRVGFVAADPARIKAMSSYQGHTTSNICSIAQKAALAALTGPMECVETMRKAFLKRRDLGLEVIASWPFAVCPKPDGAFYFFVDVSPCLRGRVTNSTQLCEFLLSEAHVALVPGAAFGDDNCIRFSYAVAEETLLEALDKVGNVLKLLAANN